MNKREPDLSPKNSFGRLSIQQRLPLFICLLLLAVVGAFGTISYISVKNASMAVGTERVTTLADKLSDMFRISFNNLAGNLRHLAADSNVRAFLTKGDDKDKRAALSAFQKILEKDTTNKLIQLLDADKHVTLSAGAQLASLNVNIDSLKLRSPAGPGYFDAGKMAVSNGLMYYPVLAAVSDGGTVKGYIVEWKILRATRQSLEQLSQLLGSNGALYFGNDDQQFWTDLLRPVSRPPVGPDALTGSAEYSRSGGEVIASMRKIPNARWLVLVELSGASFQKTAGIFLRWMLVIGVSLIIAGSLGGWLMSRKITLPLKQLSRAAAAIAEGDYSQRVAVGREDELGTLAASFNIMAAKVHASQQELEQQVEDRTKQLETARTDIEYQKESDRKKDEFISIASHELKTPLTTLKAFIQLAGKELQPELKSYNFIGNASRQLNRMERLITDLLDVSRINSGKMQYNFEDFDFEALLKATVESAQHISQGHSLVLERSADAKIHADRHRIEQVIVNLLSNAVKYSPEADKVIVWSEIKNGLLRVHFRDFGIGISKKNMEGLFDRYYRIEGSEYRFQGLGLGLFISSEIIKRHNGRIWATSEPGKGSDFVFELPVV